MIILSLDISSTSTGWSVLKHGRFYKRSEIDFGFIRPSSKFTKPEKLVFFRDRLLEILDKVDPDVVCMEDVFYFKNVKTLKLLSKFAGVACEAIRRFGIEPTIVAVKSSRTVLGTQDKEEVFDILKDKYKMSNWEFSKHNDVTDALVIALYVNSCIKGEKV